MNLTFIVEKMIMDILLEEKYTFSIQYLYGLNNTKLKTKHMKTAMQELINKIQYSIDKQSGLSITKEQENTLEAIKLVAESLLDKEKQQLQKAFSDGQETPINHPTLPHYSRDEYYIDNYNQKELIIVDFDKVKEEWIKEANGMTELEKVKYYFKKINDNQNK